MNPSDVTLATYEAAAVRYRERGAELGRPSPLLEFLDRFAALVGPGAEVLELGSGPGRDALYLERRGLRVKRTDGTHAFVDMMRNDGFDAQVLDIRTDDLGGPFAGVLANAVLLHLSRQEFSDTLEMVRRAVVDDGVFAFTVKEGDGAAWSNDKLDLPRHFTYWREAGVRTALGATGWIVDSIEHIPDTFGRSEPWLFVVVRPAVR
jgi:SAM-dependent methyltransferase